MKIAVPENIKSGVTLDDVDYGQPFKFIEGSGLYIKGYEDGVECVINLKDGKVLPVHHPESCYGVSSDSLIIPVNAKVVVE